MDTETDDFRALQYDPQKNQFRLCRIKHIPLEDEEVLVRVAYAGLCATDFLIINSELPCRLNPITLGHEISGTVHKMGYLVKDIALGDRVVINPRSDTYCCIRCKRLCSCIGKRISVGMYINGGFAEYCLVPSNMVHKISEHTLLKEAVLCSALCDVLHTWKQAIPVAFSDRILVLGAGLHGILLTVILHLKGYRKVIITEPTRERQAVLSKLVPEFRVISPQQLLKLKNNGTWRPDLVLDCSGSPTAIYDALSCLDQGARLILNRCSIEDQKIPISPYQIISKEIKIIGSLTDSRSFPEVLNVMDIIAEKYINFEEWGIKVYQLDDYEQAFLDLEDGFVTKVVFKVDENLEEHRLSRTSSQEVADVIRMNLQQLVNSIPETSQPIDTYEPYTTITKSYVSALFDALRTRESLLLDIQIPEELEELAGKSYDTVRRTLEAIKNKGLTE